MFDGNDPFEAADRAAERSNEYYGRVECTAQFVVLKKGQGKLTYNDSQHKKEDRRTELAIVVNPIDAMGLKFNVERNVLAESQEWSRIVWPSLRDLGLKSARELHGKWVKCELVDAGRKWIDKNGNERTQTTLRFVELYGSQAECEAAYESSGAAPATNGNGNGDDSGVAGDNGKAAALAFVETLVQQTNGDRNLLAQLIAGMPMINAHFTVDSPEVQGLLQKAGA